MEARRAEAAAEAKKKKFLINEEHTWDVKRKREAADDRKEKMDEKILTTLESIVAKDKKEIAKKRNEQKKKAKERKLSGDLKKEQLENLTVKAEQIKLERERKALRGRR